MVVVGLNLHLQHDEKLKFSTFYSIFTHRSCFTVIVDLQAAFVSSFEGHQTAIGYNGLYSAHYTAWDQGQDASGRPEFYIKVRSQCRTCTSPR